MSKDVDFKKEWEKTKKVLLNLSKEAGVAIKKGEEELLRLSHKGKLHFDSTANSVKKESLFYQIGKEYVQAFDKGATTSTKLEKLVKDLKTLEKQQSGLKKKIATFEAKAKKKTTCKRTVKKTSAAKKKTVQAEVIDPVEEKE